MSLKPKVALSQDFLLQLPKLPSNVQAKIMKWAFLFQTDPKSPSINYEKIHAAAVNQFIVSLNNNTRDNSNIQYFLVERYLDRLLMAVYFQTQYPNDFDFISLYEEEPDEI